jgi:hypothetical protein
MRSFRGAALAAALGLWVTSATAADPRPAEPAGRPTDSTRAADALKKKAEENWETAGAGKFVTHETKHFLLLAPEALQKRLDAAGVLLEKHHDLAKNALKFDLKEENKGEVLPGRVTAYLFGEREHFTGFVRRIERRRLLPEETGSYSAADDDLHVAVSPPRERQGSPVEVQAAEQAAALLLARRAGVRTPLPDWLTSGFGRATYYRAAPRERAVLNERGYAARWSRSHGAGEIWEGRVNADEAAALDGSLVDFLAYGPGAAKFPAFVAGFAPGENMQRKTTGQAFEAAGLKPDRVARSWKTWAANPR